MRRRLLLAVLLLSGFRVQAAQTLGQRIEQLLSKGLTARHGHWGVYVVDMEAGRTLFSLREDYYFVPASLAKLFTGALVLRRLGPNYRFRTLVAGSQGPDASGLLAGDLLLIGGGDPTLSGRRFPYRPDSTPDHPFAPLRQLADQLLDRGVRRVSGAVVGDDTAYLWEPAPAGRPVDDLLWSFGAPVSALSFNENAVQLTLRPAARPGELAELVLDPPVEYFLLDHRVVTTPKGGTRSLRLSKGTGPRQLVLSGNLPVGSGPQSHLLAVDDPALFAAAAFRHVLEESGITVEGGTRAVHRYRDQSPPRVPAGQPARLLYLAARLSPPLADILTVTLKESVNLQAELLLNEAGRQASGIGSLEAGLAEMGRFLEAAGIPKDEVRLVDGSGLSVYNLVTPRAVTALLLHMYRSRDKEVFLECLPLAGVESTLRDRLRLAGRKGWVRAKTGTLNRASGIAGYAGAASGKVYAFAIMAGNYVTTAAEIRSIMDELIMLMIE